MSQIIDNKREVTLLFGDIYIPYMTRHFNDKDVLLYAHAQDSERWTIIEQQSEGQLRFIDKKILDE